MQDSELQFFAYIFCSELCFIFLGLLWQRKHFYSYSYSYWNFWENNIFLGHRFVYNNLHIIRWKFEFKQFTNHFSKNFMVPGSWTSPWGIIYHKLRTKVNKVYGHRLLNTLLRSLCVWHIPKHLSCKSKSVINMWRVGNILWSPHGMF